MSRVGLVYPHANIDTVPSLIGAAEGLAAHGYDVDVYALTQAGQPAPRFGSPRIQLRSLGTEGLAEQSTARLRGLVRGAGWLPAAARRPLLGGYRVLGAGLAHGSRLAARARHRAAAPPAETYTCLIGVDPDGLDLASSMARGAPVGYYSLELLLSYELRTPGEAAVKARERAQSQAAAFVIVQDEARGRLLADDNGIPWDRVILVPNAPPGPARRTPTRYWHARFDLPSDARVVLHAGSLGDWTGIDGLVDSVATWPAPWVLVVHTRYDAASSPYVDALRRRADPQRVFFSLQPVPHDEYDALIDGGDVGLAFYIASDASSFTQQNIQTIGLSSGKLAYYLRAGLPVIVNLAASVAQAVEASGSGVAVEDATGVAGALTKIASSPGAYAAAACAFFTRELDFDQAFARVIERLEPQPVGSIGVIETIADGGTVLSYLIRGGPLPEQTTFLTPDDCNLQVGHVVYPAGGVVARHVHLPIERRIVGTTEVLIVERGQCEVDIYSSDRRLIATRQMLARDILVTVTGGHSFRALDDLVLLEVKQGPYPGGAEKERW